MTNINQEDQIRQLLIKVISEERQQSIKNAIQEEKTIALNDAKMDLQQTEVSITLGQRITTAEAIKKLLDKRITKARNNYYESSKITRKNWKRRTTH
jgi:hypothetical protein